MNMMLKFQTYGRWLAFVSFLGFMLIEGGPLSHPARAQQNFPNAVVGTPVKPIAVLTVGPAQVRTPEDIRQAEAANQGRIPPVIEIPFRPTMSEAAYEEAKAAAATARPNRLAEPVAGGLLAPPVAVQSFEGVDRNEAGGLFPPDPHGAVGATQFVQVVNSHIAIYEKTPPFSRIQSVSLASFFGYFTRTLFDPRVVYDSTWDRWIVAADAFPESPTVQYQFLAVSQTSDAVGPYSTYRINVTLDSGDFWDYPQLGMDQDAVIVTANIFGPTAFRGAAMFAVAKDLLYNGLDFSVPIFAGLVGTLAPPIVLDENPKTFLVAARPIGNTVTKYTLEQSGQGLNATLTPSIITVPAYRVPPKASQCGTSVQLETLDSRFLNASTQVGDSLWQVHTINVEGRPRPRFYEFNTATDTIIQSGFFHASDTSYDWNASVAVDTSNNHVFVTWSSTDPSACIHAQVRVSGRQQCTDPPGLIPAGSALFTSPTFSTRVGSGRARWGDYSAVTVDPSDPSQAWIVNEKNNSNSTWGTLIGVIGFESPCP